VTDYLHRFVSLAEKLEKAVSVKYRQKGVSPMVNEFEKFLTRTGKFENVQ